MCGPYPPYHAAPYAGTSGGPYTGGGPTTTGGVTTTGGPATTTGGGGPYSGYPFPQGQRISIPVLRKIA